jgi:hypothetical protein
MLLFNILGLQSLSCKHSEVLELVSALSEKIGESNPALNAQAIGSAMYGLQKMNSDSSEVN